MGRSQSGEQRGNVIPGRGNGMCKGLEVGKRIGRGQSGQGIVRKQGWHKIWLKTNESHVVVQTVGHNQECGIYSRCNKKPSEPATQQINSAICQDPCLQSVE